MRVLLVEDDRMIGDAVQTALRDASHAVDWVHDGAAALSAASSQRYDVMLLDPACRARTVSPCCANCASKAARCPC